MIKPLIPIAAIVILVAGIGGCVAARTSAPTGGASPESTIAALPPQHQAGGDAVRITVDDLTSPTTYVAYLHAYTDHTSPTSGISVTVDLLAGGTATWISPATGTALSYLTFDTQRRCWI